VVGVGVCVGRWVFVSGWVGVSVYYSPCCTHQLHCGGNIRYTRALNFFSFLFYRGGNMRYTRALTIPNPPLFFLMGATLDTLGHCLFENHHRGF